MAVGALAHRGALFDPSPRTDERVFVGAALAVAEGRSPYSHPVYNYPPPLAELGGRLARAGGVGALLAAARGANLLACAALAAWAAGFAGLGARGRWLLAAGLVAATPGIGAALGWGNLAPLAIVAALAAWAVGERRPLAGAALVAASLAIKPLALGGVLYRTARGLGAARADSRRPLEALAWLPATALALAPWAGELGALARRMSEPPLFSPRNLSLRRVADAAGLDLPAPALLAGVVVAALWLARRRPDDDFDRAHVAPIVSLAALPVVWSHAFLFVLPLQVAAARRYWDRRALRRRRRDRAAVVERWGVPTAVLAVQGSAAAGIEFGAPAAIHALIVLVPIVAPAALAAYLLRAPAPSDE